MIDIRVYNLELFERGVDDWAEKRVPGAVRDAHKRIALKVLQGCIMGTPVDTGTARGGWDVVERASSALTGRKDPTGMSTFGEGSAKIVGYLNARISEFTIIYVQNNVHYIGVLERGHSPQNRYWVAATVTAVQAGL
jgi:hypothetical protein